MTRRRLVLTRVLGAHWRIRAVTLFVADRLLLHASVPPPGLRAGPSRPGPVADEWPLVVLVCHGSDPDGADRLVAALARVSDAVGGCRFLLVLPAPLLAVGRRASWPVEHVVDQRTWARRHPSAVWSEYLTGRVDQLRRDYAAAAVLPVRLDDEGPENIDVLEALVRAVAAGHRTRSWQRAALAFRRAVDVPGVS